MNLVARQANQKIIEIENCDESTLALFDELLRLIQQLLDDIQDSDWIPLAAAYVIVSVGPRLERVKAKEPQLQNTIADCSLRIHEAISSQFDLDSMAFDAPLFSIANDICFDLRNLNGLTKENKTRFASCLIQHTIEWTEKQSVPSEFVAYFSEFLPAIHSAAEIYKGRDEHECISNAVDKIQAQIFDFLNPP